MHRLSPPRKGFTPLHKHCRDGNLEEVLNLIETGVDINQDDDHGKTPLDYACMKGRFEVAKSLIEAGARSGPTSFAVHKGMQPLHYACLNGHIRIVKLLIEQGSDVNASSDCRRRRWWTPLHFASASGNIELMNLLLESNANMRIRDKAYNTALHLACEKGHDELVEALVKAGAKIDDYNRERYPIHFASENGHAGAVRKLIELGAQVEVLDIRGKTPLCKAVCNGHLEVAEILLAAGAILNYECVYEMWRVPCKCITLSHVCGIGCVGVARRLLEKRPKIYEKDAVGDSPLHLACRNRNVKMVEVLLELSDVDANQKNSSSETPLHLACKSGAVDTVEFLLKYGVNLEDRNSQGLKPIHVAGLYCSVPTVRLELLMALLDYGVDVDGTDGKGWTLLHYACKTGDTELIKVLLENGSDVNKKDPGGNIDTRGIVFRSVSDEYVSTWALLLDYGAEFILFLSRLSLAGFDVEKKHSIKLQVAGLAIPKPLITQTSSIPNKTVRDVNSEVFANLCEEELQRMKSESIGLSSVTYYDLLIGQDISTLRKQLPWSLTSEPCCQKFPIYGNIIYSHFVRLKKVILMDYCGTFFGLTELPYLPPECVAMVLKYLTNRDLKNLGEILDAELSSK